MVYILSNIHLHFPVNSLSDSLSFDNSEHCTVLNHDIRINSISEQWRIQDFPQGGAPTLKIAIIFQIFAENCMKMKEFGPGGGGGASLAPPLGSANGELSQEVIPFVSLSFPGNSSLSYLFILLIIPAAILFLALTYRKKRICFEPAKKSAFYLWSLPLGKLEK